MANRLLELAADARLKIDAPRTSVADGFTPEARAAIVELTDRLAEDVDRQLAERVVTRWILTRRPIRECLANEQGEQG